MFFVLILVDGWRMRMRMEKNVLFFATKDGPEGQITSKMRWFWVTRNLSAFHCTSGGFES